MKWLLGLVTGNPMVMIWLIVGAFGFGLVGGGAAAWKWQGNKLDVVTAKFEGFVGTTKALGDAAQLDAFRKSEHNQFNQQKADRENKSTLNSLRADNQRLRDARASSSYVSPASPTAKRPDLVCYDRTLLEPALHRSDERVAGLIEEGGEAVVNLNTAKTWAGAVQ